LVERVAGQRAGTTFTAPAVQAAKLHTADPGAAGTTAAAAGDTTRKALTFNAASAGSMSLTSSPAAWTNGGTSETLTHISVWDSTTAGNFQYSAALTASQAWVSTNTFTLTSLSRFPSPRLRLVSHCDTLITAAGEGANATLTVCAGVFITDPLRPWTLVSDDGKTAVFTATA
jgi:hypothetical protein